jgi:4-hydroxybenzoyl-CoA reductase subunit beta
MMRLPPFTYLAPVSVADAVKLMADHGSEAMLVAGGTDLYPNMKRRQFEPTVLVGLRGVRDLIGVRQPGAGALAIGAGTTLSAVARHPEVRARYAALATAAGAVSTPSSATWARSAATCAWTRAATTTTSPTSGGRRSTSA